MKIFSIVMTVMMALMTFWWQKTLRPMIAMWRVFHVPTADQEVMMHDLQGVSVDLLTRGLQAAKVESASQKERKRVLLLGKDPQSKYCKLHNALTNKTVCTHECYYILCYFN